MKLQRERPTDVLSHYVYIRTYPHTFNATYNIILMVLLLGMANPNREGALEGRLSEGGCFGESLLKGKADALHYAG